MAVVLFLDNYDRYLYKDGIESLKLELKSNNILTCEEMGYPGVEVYIMTKNIVCFMDKEAYNKEYEPDEMIPVRWIKKREQKLRDMGYQKLNTELILEANTLSNLVYDWKKAEEIHED